MAPDFAIILSSVVLISVGYASQFSLGSILLEKFIVTSCSHIFCNDDGMREFEKAFTCPACHTALSGKYDIIKVDLNPSEQYKSMVLAGQRPEVIFEVCSRAIAFWTYQVHQETMFQKYVSTKAKKNSIQLEKYYQDTLQRAKNDLISIKEQQESTQKDLETFQKKTAELSEKLTERVRQYQKLQSLYEALKRKFISPSYFEKQANEEKLIEKSKIPFVMSTASEILCPQGNQNSSRNKRLNFPEIESHKNSPRNKRINYSKAERDFVLRPAHTPTDDIAIDSTILNYASQIQFGSQDKRNIPPKISLNVRSN